MDLASEIKLLRDAADQLSESGDLISAMLIDDIAFALGRGKTWDQLVDDCAVRIPYEN